MTFGKVIIALVNKRNLTRDEQEKTSKLYWDASKQRGPNEVLPG